MGIDEAQGVPGASIAIQYSQFKILAFESSVVKPAKEPLPSYLRFAVRSKFEVDELPVSIRHNTVHCQNAAPAAFQQAFGPQIDAVQDEILIGVGQRALVETPHVLIQNLCNPADGGGTESFRADERFQYLLDSPGGGA